MGPHVNRRPQTMAVRRSMVARPMLVRLPRGPGGPVTTAQSRAHRRVKVTVFSLELGMAPVLLVDEPRVFQQRMR